MLMTAKTTAVCCMQLQCFFLSTTSLLGFSPFNRLMSCTMLACRYACTIQKYIANMAKASSYSYMYYYLTLIV